MAIINTRKDFQSESRKRLASKIAVQIAIARSAKGSSPEELAAFHEVGRLLYDESRRAFVLEDIPATLRPAPWLEVINHLLEEHTALGVQSKALLDAVNYFLGSQQQSEPARIYN